MARRAWMFATAAVLLGTAAWLGWLAFSDTVEDAPLPETTFTVDNPTPQPIDPQQVADLKPGTITIPAINATAPIVNTQLPTIPHSQTVGWETDSTPLDDTSEGTTLLVGHVSGRGTPGAIHDLYQVQPGDNILTRSSTGQTRRWIVTALSIVIKEDLPEELFTLTGPNRLAVVTCGGPIITRKDGSRHYRDNVIATAIPYPITPIDTTSPDTAS